GRGAGDGGARSGGWDVGGEGEERAAAYEVQGANIGAGEGARGAACAVLQWVPATVLFPDDGCDGGDVVESGGGDGDAGGQCECDGGVDQPDCNGSGGAVCGARGRQDRRLRRRHRNPVVGLTHRMNRGMNG